MDILIFGHNTDEIDIITKLLASNPLPNGYIYTAVSYLTTGQVRVQAMSGMLANWYLDTGERTSETADSLEAAVNFLIERLGG